MRYRITIRIGPEKSVNEIREVTVDADDIRGALKKLAENISTLLGCEHYRESNLKICDIKPDLRKMS